jgi:glucokinase
MPLKFESMEQMGETLAEMAIALAEENNIPRDQVASVGMGFPGPVDNKRGVVVKTVNIPIRSMPVAEMFHKYWDLPVYLGNDADCAALGEFYHYEDKNIESLILVTLGTGIGTGIILGGKIHTGINGCAGEGGHIVIVHNGDQCTCGRKGCWERYASANALIRQTIAAMDEHPDSAMWGLAGGALNRVDGRTAFEAMRKGDATARAVVDQYLEYLGEGLSNFVNIFQPEVIALGGGVSHERDEDLLVPLQSMVLEQCFGREAEKHPKLVKARLGNDAGIIGAALLGLAQ